MSEVNQGPVSIDGALAHYPQMPGAAQSRLSTFVNT